MLRRARSIAGPHTSTALTVAADDGFGVAAHRFEPAAGARATVVILGATAVPQSYYARFASWLAGAGVRAVTFDYRGIGQSRPASLRGFRATMTDWAQRDARAVLAHVRQRHGRRPPIPSGEPSRGARKEGPIFLVGHSFGGQLIGLIDEARDVAGAVLVGAQLGWVGHWNGYLRVRNEFAFRALIPAVTRIAGYLPGSLGLGEDLPSGVAREWAKWCLSPGYLTAHHQGAAERFARFDRPVLSYRFTDDDFAPAAAVGALREALSGARVLHSRDIDPTDIGAGPIGHFGFFRPRFEQSLWQDTLAFIDNIADGRTQLPAAPWQLSPSEIEEQLLYHVA